MKITEGNLITLSRTKRFSQATAYILKLKQKKVFTNLYTTAHVENPHLKLQIRRLVAVAASAAGAAGMTFLRIRELKIPVCFF
jgi:hypothetical protein